MVRNREEPRVNRSDSNGMVLERPRAPLITLVQGLALQTRPAHLSADRTSYFVRRHRCLFVVRRCAFTATQVPVPYSGFIDPSAQISRAERIITAHTTVLLPTISHRNRRRYRATTVS